MTATRIALGPLLPPSLGDAALAALHNHDAEPLVVAVASLVGAEVSGVLIYGGSAAQPATANDVDLVVLCDKSVSGGIWGDAGPVKIDAHLHHRAQLLSEPLGAWTKYRAARVLYDDKPAELENWLRDLRIYVEQNPNPWDDVDRVRDSVWAERMIARVRAATSVDPSLAALHEARLLSQLAALHAQANHTYQTSLSVWWAQMSIEDSPVGAAVRSYFASRTFPPDANALEKLIQAVNGV